MRRARDLGWPESKTFDIAMPLRRGGHKPDHSLDVDSILRQAEDGTISDAERKLLRGYFTSLLVPSVRIGAFTFTGATEFCIVAAVRGPDERLMKQMREAVPIIMAESGINVAASLGMLSQRQVDDLVEPVGQEQDVLLLDRRRESAVGQVVNLVRDVVALMFELAQPGMAVSVLCQRLP